MSIELTKEETENLILVALDDLLQNAHYPENGVRIEALARAVKIDVIELKKFVNELKQKNAVDWTFQSVRGGEFYIKQTEQTIEKLEKNNATTINETAVLLLKKTYDIYKRAGYDSTFQFDSTFIGAIIGFSSIPKIRSAIEMLEDKGLINEPAIMSGNIIYHISVKGIDMIEKEPEKQIAGNNYYINSPGGNIAINSPNANQSISSNELEGYLALMEKLINENLRGADKTNSINDLEILKELIKSNQPKKNLIQRVLENLDKIPALIGIVQKIREAIGQ